MIPVITTARLPIIDVRFTEPATDDEYVTYLAELARLSAAHQPHVVILDVGSSTMPQSQRKHQGIWLKVHEDVIAANCRGVAFISTSATQRFILSSVFLFSSMPTEYVVFKTPGDAETWARSRLSSSSAA